MQQFSVASDQPGKAADKSRRRSGVVGPPDLAEIRIHTPVSLVVPTYRERSNLPALVERIGRLRREYNLELELLIMDDDSRDGSAEWRFYSDFAQMWQAESGAKRWQAGSGVQDVSRR